MNRQEALGALMAGGEKFAREIGDRVTDYVFVASTRPARWTTTTDVFRDEGLSIAVVGVDDWTDELEELIETDPRRAVAEWDVAFVLDDGERVEVFGRSPEYLRNLPTVADALNDIGAYLAISSPRGPVRHPFPSASRDVPPPRPRVTPPRQKSLGVPPQGNGAPFSLGP